MSKQKVTFGDNANVGSGSFNINSKIENSFNSLKESKADDVVKTLLEQLLTEIKALNEKVPASQAQSVENMAECADTLVIKSKNATPNKEWYQLSLKGIKEAASTVGEIAMPVLLIAEKLAPLLL